MRREETRMIIRQEDLAKVRQSHINSRIVLLKGSFDLLHLGHINRMRAAKALGDILVVFVKCDEAIKLKGPDRPIEDENQRAAMVDAIRYVDYTVIANRKTDVGIDTVPEHDRDQYLRYYKMISDLKPDVLIKPRKVQIYTKRSGLRFIVWKRRPGSPRPYWSTKSVGCSEREW